MKLPALLNMKPKFYTKPWITQKFNQTDISKFIFLDFKSMIFLSDEVFVTM